MDTYIIVKEGSVTVAKYEFIIPLSKGDIVDIDGPGIVTGKQIGRAHV